MELEVKILNINYDELSNKIISLGGKLLTDDEQKLYTYDLISIYGKFIDIKHSLNMLKDTTKYDSIISKIKLLFFDVENMICGNDFNNLLKILEVETLSDLYTNDNILNIINKPSLDIFLSKYCNNNRKWIRLRSGRNKTTLAVKQILNDNNSGIQQMYENEIDVLDFDETNKLLEALGFSHKSKQFKRRVTFQLDNDILDIDFWPDIPPFLEIEADSKEKIISILNKLNYKFDDTVSCTVDVIYEMYGLNQFEKETK